jgi:uncharacterized phage protein (TIGR02218 family)
MFDPKDCVATMETSAVKLMPAITDEDIHSGAWDYAAIELFEVNVDDLTMGKNILRSGTLGEVKGGRSKFTAELRGLMQAYSRRIIRLTTEDCTADLGDSRCKVDLSLYSFSGHVGSVTDNRVISDAARGEPDDYFTGGKLLFLTGENAGLAMDVKKSTPGLLELHERMPFEIAADDMYHVSAGCSKRAFEDCRDRFNNYVNFRGFPDVPGASVYRRGKEGVSNA